MATYEWHLGDELWLQSDTGFFLQGVGGRPVPQGWTPEALARQMGARERAPDCAGDAAGCSALYPSAFRYCPSCGKDLPTGASGSQELWLPPFGNDPGRQQKPTGLRLTEHSLLLADGVSASSRANRSLPLPRGGNFQFLVASLGTKRPALVAVDLRDGLLFVWTGNGDGGWSEIRAAGGSHLGEWSLPAHTWGMVVQDASQSGRIWLPTDDGLCEVVIDLPTLSYTAEYVGLDGCMGAPIVLGGQLLVPGVGETGGLSILSLAMTKDAKQRTTSLSVEGGLPDGLRVFHSALGTPKRAIWECDEGQLLAGTRPKGGIGAEFLPWPEDRQPWFALGAPYCDRNGNLWRQCRDAAGFVRYVRLGKDPEEFSADGPRFSTGGLSFRQGQVIPESLRPWDEVQVEMAAQGRLIIPLVEHDRGDVAVCAELDASGSIETVLNSPARHSGRFCLRGDTRRDFLNFDMARPWEARVFVWDGHLFLYHPDLEEIQGWRLAQ